MKVFAIVAIYNGMRNDWIQKCFNSIKNSSIPVDIIAVDNRSSDGSVSFIKEHYPEIILIELSKNVGFGTANNIGLKKGLELGSEHFFLLNQDAWVEPNTIEVLINKSIENPEYAIISPIHLNGAGTSLDDNFSNYIIPSKCQNLYSDFVLNKIEDKLYDLNFVNAAAWLLNLNSLKRIGGFNPIFFHYGEDNNYCHRVLFHKMKIGVYPFAKIYHDRENRNNTLTDLDKEEILNIIKYSNPLIKNNYKNELTQLKIILLKNYIMRRKQQVKSNRKKIIFLKNNYNNIEESKIESQSDRLFKFLD